MPAFLASCSLLLSPALERFEPAEFPLQVFPLAVRFLNYTKTTKYEAPEKHAVPKRQIPQLAISSTAATIEKPPLYWDCFGLFIG
jgi:hypothetical protein